MLLGRSNERRENEICKWVQRTRKSNRWGCSNVCEPKITTNADRKMFHCLHLRKSGNSEYKFNALLSSFDLSKKKILFRLIDRLKMEKLIRLLLRQICRRNHSKSQRWMKSLKNANRLVIRIAVSSPSNFPTACIKILWPVTRDKNRTNSMIYVTQAQMMNVILLS